MIAVGTYHEYVGYLLLGGGGHPDGKAPRLDGGDNFARRVGYQHNSNRDKNFAFKYTK